MKIKHSGLSTNDVIDAQKQFGVNKLPEKAPPSKLSILISQFRSSLVYVLLFAGIVTALMGHMSDAVIILAAVILNTFLGYIQESKASNSLTALKKFVTQYSELIRDGERRRVLSEKIVPGDVVILTMGTKIPADGELLEVNRFFADEALLTGESIQVAKEVGEDVYMGTTVTAGMAIMKVTRIGDRTKIGSIALTIQDVKEEPKMKKQLSDFSQKLVYLVLVSVSVVFGVGLWKGEDMLTMFTTAVALAVASIPEGLLISLTVILAMGMQRILKKQGLVRKLASAETLGGVTTICVDKTGTLTEGKMKVVDVIGDEKRLAKQVVLANDLDDPIVISAHAWGAERMADKDARRDRVDSIPFSPTDRYFACLVKRDTNTNTLYLNGAPEVILERCKMSKDEGKTVETMILDLSSMGKRLLGFALKKVSTDITRIEKTNLEEDFEWVGLMAFFDPVRNGVREALSEAHDAGVKVITITGDYPKNTQVILSEIGIELDESEIMTGEELKDLSDAEISERSRKVRLFARTTPDQKLKIVQILKRRGEIVAMMGDGVNDAPAIHAADIGVVVAEASDVARESADLVLLNSNFSIVVAAIEEGRMIFDNARKVIMYLLSDSFAEIFIVVGGILLGLPLPLTAIQILWINLVTDSLPNLALTMDPARQNIMNLGPKKSSENLIASWMMWLTGFVSLMSAVVCLVYFKYIYDTTQLVELGRAVVFVTLGFKSLLYVFSVRTLMTPIWEIGIRGNKYLYGAVGIGLVLLTLPFWTMQTQDFFGVGSLNSTQWIVAMALSVTIFGLVEIFKYGYNKVTNQK